MKKVAVILSGCGFLDGAEIREAVLTLLELDLAAISVDIFAPDVTQHHVINHLTGDPQQHETRNVLQEAARIARGDIRPLEKLQPEHYLGLVLPGGFGVAKNLSDFAFKGADGDVLKALKPIIQTFHHQHKPIVAVCIAPTLLAMTLSKQNPHLTIGTDAETAQELTKAGAKHQACATRDCVVDHQNRLISTPAYMDGSAQLKEVHAGIHQAIQALDQWIK